MQDRKNGAEKRDFDQRWTHRGNKFVIGTIHGDPIEIVAQYNPKELARQAAATWNPHPNTSAKYSPSGESQMWSEYKTTAPRTLTVELLFDGYEEGISVASVVEDLERLTIPVDMKSRDESKRRPQLCVAVWGKQQLRCVVQSVATKLTMFDEAGAPLRATCTVVLAEVDVVAMMKSDVHGAIDRVAKTSGSVRSTKPGHEAPYPPEDSKPTRVPPPNRTPAAPASTASAQPAPAPKPAPAAAPAPANTVGTPSAKINPAALEGDQPASDQLFLDDPPAPAPANTVGTPSAKINPAALEGDQPASDQLFLDDPPAPAPANTVGTPSAKINPAALEGDQPASDQLFQDDPPAPDAVSGADPAGPNAKTKALYDELE